jgi:hypothetical protein
LTRSQGASISQISGAKVPPRVKDAWWQWWALRKLISLLKKIVNGFVFEQKVLQHIFHALVVQI